MLKLRKHLKPFALMLVLAVALLFLQGICDLNLPNYMSNIVDVGISKKGVESDVPTAISTDGMELLTTFMSKSDEGTFKNSYELKNLTDTEKGKPLSEVYPSAKGSVHLLKKLTDEEYQNLAQITGKAAFAMMEMGKTISGGNAQEGTLDLSKIYPHLETLKGMESEIAEILSKFESLDPALSSQVAGALSQSFLEELGVDLSKTSMNYIFKIGLIMLAIALVGGLATVMVSFLSSKISSGVAKNLRRDIFQKVNSFSKSEIDKFSTSSLITRTTNDVTQVQNFLTMGIRFICYAPLMGIGGTIMAINKSTSMAWIIALASILIIGLMALTFVLVMPKFKRMQKLVDKINLVTRETLSGLMVIRAFGRTKKEEDRFNDANATHMKNNRYVNRVMNFIMPSINLTMNLITVLIIWIGADKIAASQMAVGDMMAFMQYAMQIVMSFMFIAMMFIFIPRAQVSVARIYEILDSKNTIEEKESPTSYNKEKEGEVEFKNVSFRYDGADEDAISGISFKVKKGERLGIIGSTGSGKSTLINLIPRFYDATEGEVLISGENVKDMSLVDLKNHIGLVPQKSMLLKGDIESNVKYGNDSLSDEKVLKAIEIAMAKEFVDSKPDGIKSFISQGGSNLSGGQRQRMAIARAVGFGPDIFVFDDSFSALDYKTDRALRDLLKKELGTKTQVIVAQRVSTIMDANEIIVLDQGKMVGKGSHKELLGSCQEYLEICETQLSKEELYESTK